MFNSLQRTLNDLYDEAVCVHAFVVFLLVVVVTAVSGVGTGHNLAVTDGSGNHFRWPSLFSHSR